MVKLADRKKNLTDIVVFGILFLAGLSLYLPSLNGEFILDAQYVVVQNPLIKQPALYKDIFTSGFFDAYKAGSYFKLNYYRPMTICSYIPDYRLWGLNPFGYRLTNVFIHALNAFLIFKLLILLFARRELSLTASFLFMIHPLHEWVVNYTVGRADLLQAFFSLCSLFCLAHYFKTPSRWKFILSVFWYFLALLSREISVILPLYSALICFYYSRNVKKTVLITLVFAVFGIGYYLFRRQLFPIVHDASVGAVSFSSLAQWIFASFEYTFRFFIPWSVLSVLPDVFRNRFIPVIFLSGAAFILLNHLWRTPEKGGRNQIFAGLAWIGIGTLPLFVTRHMFLRLGPYLSEHFLYFSSIGFVTVLGVVLAGLNRPVRIGAIALVSAYYVVVGAANNSHWTSEYALLKRVRASEHSHKFVSSQQILMKYEDNESQIHEIIREADQASIKSIWLKRLGSLYRKKGQYEKAVSFFNEAIAMNPRNAEAYNELAASLLETGKKELGLDTLKKSLAIAETPDALRILGIVSYRENDYRSAVSYLQKAHFYNPDDMEAALYLCMAYFFNHQDRAYSRMIGVICAKPISRGAVFKFIAQELYHHGNFDLAVSVLESYKSFAALDNDMRTILGWAYVSLGEKETAVKIFTDILSLDPKNISAQKGLTALRKKATPER